MPKMPKNSKSETVIEDLAETLSPRDGVIIILDLPRPWAAAGVPLPVWQAGGARRMIRLQWQQPDAAPTSKPALQGKAGTPSATK